MVRELRTTERTQVIVLYLGAVSTCGAAIMCVLLPGGFVIPRDVATVVILLGAGA